jgi:hypothetical protein
MKALMDNAPGFITVLSTLLASVQFNMGKEFIYEAESPMKLTPKPQLYGEI